MKRRITSISTALACLLGIQLTPSALAAGENTLFITKSVLRPEHTYVVAASNELAFCIKQDRLKHLIKIQKERALSFCKWHNFPYLFSYSVRMEYKTNFEFGKAYRMESGKAISIEEFPLNVSSPLNASRMPRPKPNFLTNEKLANTHLEKDFISAYSSDFQDYYPHIVLSELMCSFDKYEEIDLDT